MALPTWKHSKGHHNEVLSGASSKESNDTAELRTEAMSPRKERAVKKQIQVAQCTPQTWVWPREEQDRHQAEIKMEKQKDWPEKQQQFSQS